MLRDNADAEAGGYNYAQRSFRKAGHLKKIGGIVFICNVARVDIPSVGLLPQYATLIKEKATLRALINSAMSIITRCHNQDDKGIDAVLDAAEKTIFDISNKRVAKSFAQIDIWLKKTFQHLSNIKSLHRGITGIPSGFKKLDAMTSGSQKSDLIVLAARPSMGKTALALGLAHQAAEQERV